MLTIGLIESLCAMNQIRQPEPLMYAKGAGAKGTFLPYMPMKDYTKACFLRNTEIETPVFVRFSRMMGRPGSADSRRDVREFSVKFFTEEGVYDLLGSSLPVTFINDPEKYSDLFKALSPCPRTNIYKPESFWRFVSKNPEAMHMVTWLYSNKGTIKSFRGMEGHSVYTYIWENEDCHKHWVRYHWLPSEPADGISQHEAEFLAGYDPDVAIRDLYKTFDEGGLVTYELCVQIISARQSMENERTLLDPTVIWPESSVPWIKVGRMILDSGIDDYTKEIEKTNFSPNSLVKGIDISPEPMLLAITFLSMNKEGYNFKSVNSEICNSLAYKELPLISCGDKFNDNRNFVAGQLAWRLRSMKDKEKDAFIENIGMELLFMDDDLQRTIVGLIMEASENLGDSLKKWLGHI